LNRENPSFSLRQLFLILLLTFSGFILVDMLWQGENDAKIRILLLEGFTIIPALILIRMKHISAKQAFRLHPVSVRICGISLVIGVGLTIVTDALNRLLQLVIPMPQDLSNLLESVFKCESFFDGIIVFTGVVVIAALSEEMLFRGLVQGTLEKRMDITRAVMATAIVFTILHFNPWQAIPILILGVALGILTWKSGSIYSAIIIHALMNLLSVLSVNISASFLNRFFYSTWTAPFWILAGCAGLVWGFRLFYKWAE